MKLTLILKEIGNPIVLDTRYVTSEASMWRWIKTYRDQLQEDSSLHKEWLNGGRYFTVKTNDGSIYKEIYFRLNKNGKIEMPNRLNQAQSAAVKNEKNVPLKKHFLKNNGFSEKQFEDCNKIFAIIKEAGTLDSLDI